LIASESSSEEGPKKARKKYGLFAEIMPAPREETRLLNTVIIQ